MRVCIAADHGGFDLKNELYVRLKNKYEVVDLGASAFDDNDDYPDFVMLVVRAITSGQAERGILVCGSGVGACIAANKVPGIRAGLCHDTYSAHQGVEHDNMNVLCLGGRVIGIELAVALAEAFLSSSFSEGERHRRRLQKVLFIEKEFRRNE
ncbi:MAG: ribose 5-phosphate isomerase B [Chloroflexi bacterium]|nr:ribose 5-phosphate isomerase B [Chloroflexota bacterium]